MDLRRLFRRGRRRDVDAEAQEIRYDCIEFSPSKSDVTFRLRGDIVKTLTVESGRFVVIYLPNSLTLHPTAEQIRSV